MMQSLARAATVLVVALVGGCGLWRDEDPCVAVEEYQDARVSTTIQVPEGLQQPDSGGKLVIPEVAAPPGPLSANAACLQKPPNYFDKPIVKPAD
ncbi:MAG: hypothetical protein FJ197_08770 [Gammaproteobacteria bacterium]|nr:hypothetical protein [Gammaproteobacteria bacterium]